MRKIFGLVILISSQLLSPITADETFTCDPIPNSPPRQLSGGNVATGTYDPSIYLRLISPDEQQASLLAVQAKWLLYLRRNDRWITRLLSKLDRMKFIINSRLERMSDKITRRLKDNGLSPMIKFHRIYNQMMNPITNPFLNMNISNKIMTPVEQQSDPAFVQFQQNLHEHAESYANSLAHLQSGLFVGNVYNDVYDAILVIIVLIFHRISGM